MQMSRAALPLEAPGEGPSCLPRLLGPQASCARGSITQVSASAFHSFIVSVSKSPPS